MLPLSTRTYLSTCLVFLCLEKESCETFVVLMRVHCPGGARGSNLSFFAFNTSHNSVCRRTAQVDYLIRIKHTLVVELIGNDVPVADGID